MLRKIAGNFVLLSLSFIVSLFVAEMVVRFTLFDKDSRSKGAQKIFEEHGSDYVRRFMKNTGAEGCLWMDGNLAHPYLGWVAKSYGECGHKNVNDTGLFGKTTGFTKDLSHFNIMITGGSVAEQFARGANDKIWLEEILNRDYVSPNGKPFAIVNAAYGGWKFPAQNIAVLMFGNRVDAVVALDGFNEMQFDPMDLPDVTTFMHLSREMRDEFRFINFRTTKNWREFCSNSFLRHSFLAASIHRYQMDVVSKSWSEFKAISPYANYNFPEGTKQNDRMEWSLKRLEYYIRSLSGVAKILNLKFAHFIQPIPNYRILSKDRYEALLSANSRLAKEGIATFSLADVFENVQQEIYADDIHCKFDHVTGDSLGYRLMAERIAQMLASEWRLLPKQDLTSVN